MNLLRIGTVFWLLLAGGNLTQAASLRESAPPKELATLDGGFWQVGPGLIANFSDQNLAREVGYMRDLGMDLIIIQYTASWYDHSAGTYFAYVPNTVLPYHPNFQGRDPIGSIMHAAEKHGVRVILGGLLMPLPRHINYETNLAIWTSADVMEYRRQVIERYRNSSAFYGYYAPNEPNPADLYANELDPQKMIDATAQITSFIRSQKGDLKILHSIGLYSEPDTSGPTPINRRPSIPYLDAFWRPWVEQLAEVDVWMVIDGVGTGLSDLTHTHRAQEWGAALAREHDKDFWVDVENAWMPPYTPFPIEKLVASLEVAAQHGSKIVTFDYAHYMSRLSHREAARQLHLDYAEYLWQLLNLSKSHLYLYEGLINIPVSMPLALAADTNGALYIVSINNGGDLVYLANPVASIDRSGSFPAAPSGEIVFSVTGWPALRGLQGVQVDSKGYVYLSGDNGTGAYIKKLTPAPHFNEVAAFNVSGIPTRIGGVALLNDEVLIAPAFGSLLFLNTADGSLLRTVSGGANFQREAVFNSTDQVIYALANGADSPALLRGYYAGGSAQQLDGFQFHGSVMIGDGALDSAFGGAAQNGFYDAEQYRLITADTVVNDSGFRQLRVWSISANGTQLSLAQAIDGTTRNPDGRLQPIPMSGPRDAVRTGDYLYVTTLENGGSIYVFSYNQDADTSVSGWSLY